MIRWLLAALLIDQRPARRAGESLRAFRDRQIDAVVARRYLQGEG